MKQVGLRHRVAELDYLKSVFILLMIVFHLVYIADKYPYAKQIVYTFHMPAFLVISGYLADAGKGVRGFLRKMLWIFVPYVCMEVGYTVMSHFLPVREGVPEISAGVLLQKVFVQPMGPYWYLHTLLVCYFLHYAVFRYARMQGFARVILLGLLLFATAYGSGLVAFANAMYFLAGTLVRQSEVPFTRFFSPTAWAVLPVAVLCCFPEQMNKGTLAGVAVTYLVISALLHVYRHLPRSVCDPLCFVGRNTLVIFLFSPIFTILCKIFLPFLLAEPTGMLFMAVSVVVTVAGCLLMAWCMDRLRLSRFFFGQERVLSGSWTGFH